MLDHFLGFVWSLFQSHISAVITIAYFKTHVRVLQHQNEIGWIQRCLSACRCLLLMEGMFYFVCSCKSTAQEK